MTDKVPFVENRLDGANASLATYGADSDPHRAALLAMHKYVFGQALPYTIRTIAPGRFAIR